MIGLGTRLWQRAEEQLQQAKPGRSHVCIWSHCIECSISMYILRCILYLLISCHVMFQLNLFVDYIILCFMIFDYSTEAPGIRYSNIVCSFSMPEELEGIRWSTILQLARPSDTNPGKGMFGMIIVDYNYTMVLRIFRGLHIRSANHSKWMNGNGW